VSAFEGPTTDTIPASVFAPGAGDQPPSPPSLAGGGAAGRRPPSVASSPGPAVPVGLSVPPGPTVGAPPSTARAGGKPPPPASHTDRPAEGGRPTPPSGGRSAALSAGAVAGAALGAVGVVAAALAAWWRGSTRRRGGRSSAQPSKARGAPACLTNAGDASPVLADMAEGRLPDTTAGDAEGLQALAAEALGAAILSPLQMAGARKSGVAGAINTKLDGIY
jgi:hypothetical protein